MSTERTDTSSRLSFLGLLTIVFITLKMTDQQLSVGNLLPCDVARRAGTARGVRRKDPTEP